MSAHFGPLYGERICPARENAMLFAFPALGDAADELIGSLVDMRQEWILPALGIDVDLTKWKARHLKARKTGKMPARARDEQWIGIRDELHEDHRTAKHLWQCLIQYGSAVPEPEDDLARELMLERGYARSGRIITINGVPTPAGSKQIAFFCALRFRWLNHPKTDPVRIYSGDRLYDDEHTSDMLQESLILVSLRRFLDLLKKIANVSASLFVSLWLRRMKAAEDQLHRLPANNLPQIYRRVNVDNKQQLRICCGSMFELERAADIFGELRLDGGATRKSVEEAMEALKVGNVSNIQKRDSPTSRFLAGAVAHFRALHPTMNETSSAHHDPCVGNLEDLHTNSALYKPGRSKIRHIAGERPVRLYHGIQPIALFTVALIQISENIARHEGQYWQAGIKKGAGGVMLAREVRTSIFATLMTSAFCQKTAEAMLTKNAECEDWSSEDIWCHPIVRYLVGTSASEAAEIDKEHEDLKTRAETGEPADWAFGDINVLFGTFSKNAYLEARALSNKCMPAMRKDGWTIGFRPDAWWEPAAEIEFLHNCCQFVAFSDKLKRLRIEWEPTLADWRAFFGDKFTFAHLHTGLPQQHPLERIQDFFRGVFDRLQMPGINDLLLHSPEAARNIFLRAVLPLAARSLPGISPISDDTHHFERVNAHSRPEEIRLAAFGAWNT